MAAITVQNANASGSLNYTLGSVASADTVANDGKTLLIFANANAAARTLTLDANDTEKQGFGTISTPSTTITIPGSGTNGGRCIVGFLPPDRFNNSAGNVVLSFDAVTDLTMAAVRMGTI